MPDTRNSCVAVLGLGNLLLKDDGIGIWLIRELQQAKLPYTIKLYEIGTAVFAIPSLLQEHNRLLLVDAMHGGQRPATVYDLSAEEIRLLQQQKDGITLPLFRSLHEYHILDLLEMPGNVCPDWRVFGVEPAEIDFGIGLSPLLAGLIPSLAETMKKTAEKMVTRL